MMGMRCELPLTEADPLRSRRALGFACPRDATRTLCDALNRADLHAACACFARDACLVTPDGTAVEGRAAIGGILAQLIASRVQVSVDVSAVLTAGNVALAHERWHIRYGDLGSGNATRSKPTTVLHRIESEWKLAVLAPWGWGP